MATATQRRRSSAPGSRIHTSHKRRSWLPYGIAALAAAAAVAVLIGLQVANSGADSVPPRVATGEGRVLGDPAAPVTVIEYADFQCPVCKRAESSIIRRIEEEYVLDGRVKIEFRMFPFLGQESWDAAQAAEAAREQGKFWEYHNALFNAQGRENGGAFAYDELVRLAREVGLDVARFEATLTANRYLDAIQREKDEAVAAGVNSTPTFYVNGEKIVGAQDYRVFRQAIEDALAKVEAGGAQ
jgi:protein-disulfide isomerase